MLTLVKNLYELYGLASPDRPDAVEIGPNMSGLESDPRNDWLAVALSEYQRFQAIKGNKINRAAFIGSGNGIDVIAALRLFSIEDLTVTDIVPEILPTIESNIRSNTRSERLPRHLSFVSGRDCNQLSEKFDLIYANLPLVMVKEEELGTNLATTTLRAR